MHILIVCSYPWSSSRSLRPVCSPPDGWRCTREQVQCAQSSTYNMHNRTRTTCTIEHARHVQSNTHARDSRSSTPHAMPRLLVHVTSPASWPWRPALVSIRPAILPRTPHETTHSASARQARLIDGDGYTSWRYMHWARKTDFSSCSLPCPRSMHGWLAMHERERERERERKREKERERIYSPFYVVKTMADQ